MKRKRNYTREQTKHYRENSALRMLFVNVFARDKVYKRELATMRANFAEHLYNNSEPI